MRSKSNKNVGYFLTLSVFKTELFFSLSAFFGYTYLGSDSSPIYVLLMTSIGVLSIGYCVYVLFKEPRLMISELLLLFGVPLFVMVALMISKGVSSSSLGIQQSQFNQFLGFSVPSLFLGWYLAKRKVDLTKPLFWVMLLISAGSIAAILVPFSTGRGFVVMGGASYQTASYYTAFAFGMNLYFISHRTFHKNIKILQSQTTRIILIILLILQAFMLIVPGGRGAFVLMFAYIGLFFLSLIRKENVLPILYSVIIVVLALFLMDWLLLRLINNAIFNRGLTRAIAFIGPGGKINWEGSSGRLPIYQESLRAFKESPLIGYGLYRYLSKVSFGIYPHNLFLEILLQGGLVYLGVWLVSLFAILKKLHRMIRYDRKNLLLLYVGLYPIVMLMFSGSYLSTGLFWFSIAFVVGFHIK